MINYRLFNLAVKKIIIIIMMMMTTTTTTTTTTSATTTILTDREIFQRDSLSLLLFVVALIPMTFVLRDAHFTLTL